MELTSRLTDVRPNLMEHFHIVDIENFEGFSGTTGADQQFLISVIKSVSRDEDIFDVVYGLEIKSLCHSFNH